MPSLTTTLNKIQSLDPSSDIWEELLKGLNKTQADDEPLKIEKILKMSGIDYALWALRAVDGHQGAMRLYACYCARQVLPIFEKRFPDDKRPHTAIEVAERFARGQASQKELVAAKDTAFDAARDVAYVAREATRKLFKEEFIKLCRLEGNYAYEH